MKSGKCPKCGSQDVHTGRPVAGESGGMTIALFNQVNFDIYVCVKCGFKEEYVEAKKLEQVAEKWARVKTN